MVTEEYAHIGIKTGDLAMYKLFIGFRKLGEFPTIKEAKKYAQESKLSGLFSLLGENYSDQWYVPTFGILQE